MAWKCRECGEQNFKIEYTNNKDYCEFDKEGNLIDCLEEDETILECYNCGNHAYNKKIENIADWVDEE